MDENPVHTEAIIEEKGFSLTPIYQDTGKASIQVSKKLVTQLLVEVNQITGIPFGELMTFPSQLENLIRIGKHFTGKEQNNIPTLIKNRHAVGKRTLVTGPPNVSEHLGV